MKRLITTVELLELTRENKNIILSPDCVLTPSAKDLAKELGVTIAREGTVSQLLEQRDSLGQGEDLKKLVTKILAEQLKPACATPVITHVKGDGVTIQPFDKAPYGQKIGMTDVITAREANLSAGFMTFEKSILPWRLTYDEIDYVVEGDFILRVDNHEYRCKPGDVISIPKGTEVVFGSPTKTKVFYVTYPANWSEL